MWQSAIENGAYCVLRIFADPDCAVEDYLRSVSRSDFELRNGHSGYGIFPLIMHIFII